jgi:uncharacterized protein YndB with AHSA1/START domain
MIVIEHSITVDRPAEAVFDYLADPAHYVEWQPAVERAAVVGDGDLGPGSRVRVLVRGPAGPVEAEAEITTFERPRRLALRTLSGPARAVAECDLGQTDTGGTNVHLKLQLELTGFLRFGEGMVRDRLGRELPTLLEDLRARIEAETPRMPIQPR